MKVRDYGREKVQIPSPTLSRPVTGLPYFRGLDLLSLTCFPMLVRRGHDIRGLETLLSGKDMSRSLTWAKAICSSSSAKRLPMQLRLPNPKGRDANGWGAGPSPSQRAG